MKKAAGFCDRLWCIIATVSMGLLALITGALFFRGFANYRDAGFLFEQNNTGELFFLALAAFAFFAGLFMVSSYLFKKMKKSTLKIALFFMAVIILALQAYFLFYVRSYYKWDSGFVIGGAMSLLHEGKAADAAFYYLSVYPNQNLFVLITAGLIRIGEFFKISPGNLPLVFNIFNTLCLDLSVILTLAIASKMRESFSMEKLAQSVFVLMWNPFLYLGVSYYYTIVLSLPLSMGFLYGVICIGKQERKRIDGKTIALAMLCGILLGIDFELRATAAIFAIAVFVAGLWLYFRRVRENRNRGGILSVMLLILLTALLSGAGVKSAGERFVDIDTRDTAFPVSHWVMMSLTSPGGHNEEDEQFTASFSTREEKEQAVKERMSQKLQELGTKGLVKLAAEKTENTFGRGTNGYPVFLSEAYETDQFYEAIFGNHKDFVILWHQGYYLLMLLGIFLALIRLLKQSLTEKTMDLITFTMGLILLGAILFYILWEASDQYSVPFMLVMFLLMRSGMGTFYHKAKATARRLSDVSAVYRVFAAGVLAVSLGIVFWAFAEYSAFTQVTTDYSHPVVSQIISNEPMAVSDGEKLVQTFETDQPFNQLVLQWRNPAQEESTALYQVDLVREDGKTFFSSQIDADGTGYNGAGIYQFDTITPQGQECFEIKMYKVSGQDTDDLQFVVYNMGGYDAYPGGDLYSSSAGTTRERLDSTLMFAVSNESYQSYTTPKRYVFFVTAVFISFLFIGICCKLIGIRVLREESYES